MFGSSDGKVGCAAFARAAVLLETTEKNFRKRLSSLALLIRKKCSFASKQNSRTQCGSGPTPALIPAHSLAQIKLIQTTSNRMSNLHSYTAPVVALSLIGDKLAAAYLDGLLVVIGLSGGDDVFRW